MAKVVGKNGNLSIFYVTFQLELSSNFRHQSDFFPLSLRWFRFTWRPPAVLHTRYKTLDLAAIHTLTCIAALCKRQFLPLVYCMKRYKQEVSCWHSLTHNGISGFPNDQGLFTEAEMKKNPKESNGSSRKRAAGGSSSAPTLSKKLRDKKEGTSPKQGV